MSSSAVTVVRDYGSVPGELAVCVRQVGMVERVDLSDGDLDVIGIVGRLTLPLLGALGLPVVATDVPRGIVHGPAAWLVESRVSAICCVARADGLDVRRGIAEAGRALGLGRVGHDALSQYALLERGNVTPPA